MESATLPLGALEVTLEASLEQAELPAGASLLCARCSSPAALPITLPGSPRPGMAEGGSVPLAASQGKQEGLGSLAPAAGGALAGCAVQGMKVELLGRRGSWDVWRLQHRSSVGSRTGRNRPQSHPRYPLHSFTASPLPEPHSSGDTDPKGPPLSLLCPSQPLGRRAVKPPPRPWLLVSFFCPCRTMESAGGWGSSGWLV